MTEVFPSVGKVTVKPGAKSYLRRNSESHRKSSQDRKTAIHESIGALLAPPPPPPSLPPTPDLAERRKKTKAGGGSIVAAVQAAGKQAIIGPRRSMSMSHGKKQKGVLNDPFIDALLGYQSVSIAPPPTSSGAAVRLLKKLGGSPSVLKKKSQSMTRSSSSASVPELNATFNNCSSSVSLSESSTNTRCTAPLTDDCAISLGSGASSQMGLQCRKTATTGPPPLRTLSSIGPDQLIRQNARRNLSYGNECDMALAPNDFGRRPVTRRHSVHADCTVSKKSSSRLHKGSSAVSSSGASTSSQRSRKIHLVDSVSDWGTLEFGDIEGEDGDNDSGAMEYCPMDAVDEEPAIISCLVPQFMFQTAPLIGDDKCVPVSPTHTAQSAHHSSVSIEDLPPEGNCMMNTSTYSAVGDRASTATITTDSFASLITSDSLYENDEGGTTLQAVVDSAPCTDDYADLKALYDSAFGIHADAVTIPCVEQIAPEMINAERPFCDSWTDLQFDLDEKSVTSEKKSVTSEKKKGNAKEKIRRSKSGDAVRPQKSKTPKTQQRKTACQQLTCEA